MDTIINHILKTKFNKIRFYHALILNKSHFYQLMKIFMKTLYFITNAKAKLKASYK
jgi:hypothetical protein